VHDHVDFLFFLSLSFFFFGSYEEAAGASALDPAGAVLAGEAPPDFLPRPDLRVGALRGEALALRGEAAALRGEAVAFLGEALDFLGEAAADVFCRLAAGAFLGEAAALFLPVTEPDEGLLRVPCETLLGPAADEVDPDAFFEVLVLLLAVVFLAGFLEVLAFFLGPVDFLAAGAFLVAGAALTFLLRA